MLDLKVYWREIRSVASSLPEFIWLVGGGCIVQVESTTGAQLLQAKSHRLATEEEIGAHLANEEAAKRHAAHERLRRTGIAVVPIPDAVP